ncbi:MAG: DUF2505 family protein [Myxococcota bacterium]
MKKITLTHEIDCSEERFWDVFFDEGFNTSLFREHLGFPSFETVELSKDDGGAVKRTIKAVPKMDVPKPLKKIFGDSIGYQESGTFDPSTKTWSWKLQTHTMPDKLRTEGTVRCEKISDTKVRRVAIIELEAKVFGVGGLIESTTETQMRKGWDDSAAYMNQWVKKNG